MALDSFFALTVGAATVGNVVGLRAGRRALRRRGRGARAVVSAGLAWALGVAFAWAGVRAVFGAPAPDALIPGVEMVLAAGWGLLVVFALTVGGAVHRARDREATHQTPAA